jgi:hypothetical protein
MVINLTVVLKIPTRFSETHIFSEAIILMELSKVLVGEVSWMGRNGLLDDLRRGLCFS